jgi:DNA-directed RNA polymerase subunit RPC12/RpoP
MTTSEKVAYLKGLYEGLGIDPKTKEGKLYSAVIDVLSSLASDVEDIDANCTATADAVNDISEDLSYVEEFIDSFDDGEDEDDEDFDDFDGECDYNCGECGICDEDGEASDGEDEDEDEEEEEDALELDDGQMYEVTCPACGDTVSVDESILALGHIECPGCGNILEFDMGDDEKD